MSLEQALADSTLHPVRIAVANTPNGVYNAEQGPNGRIRAYKMERWDGGGRCFPVITPVPISLNTAQTHDWHPIREGTFFEDFATRTSH